MPLFQNTVVQKYLKGQDQKKIDNAFEKYKSQFHNPSIQENIRNAKEEQYQEGFLRDLFVNILGYTLNPDNNFNLTTELKNEKDSKKADGAILINNELQTIVKAVIELKGTNTTDLGKVEAQAFGYKNNQQGCVYVVTSNFEKLRFYIDNAIEHIEFNLFTLNKEDFNLLYLCLAYENIAKDFAKKIKTESLSQEDAITKKLYKDYTVFKRALFNNLTKLNPETEALLLFKKSQKLLDRFLFLFFAEDRHLLPPNSVRLILSDWKDLQEREVEIPLYNRFKKYFEYLNTGYKGKRYDVFPYNGGLFKPDEVLDHVKINDDLLYEHTLRLSEYDFDSEVDVNILGHIFENSLNEIEEVQADLEGQAIDKSKTKRKKDGVFYTPKYITKYIVENTIGKLCTEKKAELEINEEEYTNDKKKQKKTIGVLLQKINDYRAWLLELTICDPACGSGAFLNEALDFLIKQHKILDELETKLMGGGLVFPNIENNILENNLFGVDLNEESVEIAKLSLWLRTAQPNRKLNDLSGNIKCGNSLIDDPAIAGDKAFNWQKAFPTVFKEKQKKPFHITWVTHNSRISQRMIDNKVKLGEAYWLEDEQEIMVAQTIKEIVEQDELNVMAFNSCGDHIHILLVCEEEEIPNIIRKLKGKSSQKLKEYLKIPKEEVFTLWAQKYSTTYIDSEDQLWNTVEYIRNNRQKHRLDTSNKGQLPIASHTEGDKGLKPLARMDMSEELQTSKESGNKGLQPLVAITTSNSLSQTYAHAFRTQYKGGFDVVIGNPPYVQIQSMGTVSNDLEKSNFKTFEKTGDLYCLFYELGNIILNNNGLLGFITSNKWLRANYGKSLRNYLIKNTQPLELLDLGSGIFESATVDSNLLIFKKTKNNKIPFVGLDISKEKTFTDFSIYESQKVEINVKEDKIWTISNPIEQQIKQKIETIGTPLKDWDIKINYGIKTGFNDAFIINEETKNELIRKDYKSAEIIFPIVRGRDVHRYAIDYANLYLINTHNGYGDVPAINIDDYFAVKEHLNKYYPQLEKRGDKGKTPYNLRNCAYVHDFFSENLFYPDICQRLSFTKVNSMFTNNTGYYLKTNDSFMLSVLNSKLINYYYKKISAQLGETGIRSFTIYIENIPIPKEINQLPFIEKADQMLVLNKELQLLAQKFQRTIQRRLFNNEATSNNGLQPIVVENTYTISKKLQDWYLLSYADFVKEINKGLNKRKNLIAKKLTLAEETEWEDYFLTEQQKALALKSQINQTDRTIDQMVYELYGLTEEEIKIVENS